MSWEVPIGYVRFPRVSGDEPSGQASGVAKRRVFPRVSWDEPLYQIGWFGLKEFSLRERG